MGRRRIIVRENVLNSAEKVVAEKGAAGLTIDAVARASGITKGGVQSCFGNKEAMIAAMLKRWNEHYNGRVSAATEGNNTPGARLRAHIDITFRDEANSNSRSATLLSALLQSPEYLTGVNEWYGERLRDCNETDSHERERLQLAFLATEGLFFLRYFHLVGMLAEEWEHGFMLVRRLLGDETGSADATAEPYL